MNIKTAHFKTIIASIIVAVGLWIGLVENCLATGLFDDGFESYTVGQVVPTGGSNNWYVTSADVYVSSSDAHSGSKSLNMNSSGGNGNVWSKTFTGLQTGSQYFWFKTGLNGTSDRLQFVLYNSEAGTVPMGIIDIKGGASTLTVKDNINSDSTSVSKNEWHVLGTKWANQKVQWNIDGGSWSDENAFYNLAYTKIDAIRFYKDTFTTQNFYIDDITQGEYNPYQDPTLEITFPVASETQYWAHWTLNYDLGDATSTWDMVRAYVCYGTESGDADACAYTDHSGVDTKYLYECDNATTTMAATSTIDIPVQNNLAADTYHYKAYIEASDANAGGLCAPQYWGTPLIESTQYQATLSTDLTDITNYVSPDDYWTTDWGGLWGSATSSLVYSAGSSIFDTVTEPLLEQLANFSNWFDTNTATNAGVEAGSSIGILISKAKDFINVIPGLQLFYILLIAVVVEFGIFLVRFLFKLAQLIRG